MEADFWLAACSEWGVRIAFKADAAASTPAATSAKPYGVSFLDLLTQAASDAIPGLSPTSANVQGQAGGNSDQDGSDQSDGSPAAPPRQQTSGVKQTETDSGTAAIAGAVSLGQLNGRTADASLMKAAQPGGYSKLTNGSPVRSQRTPSSTGQSETAQAGQKTAPAAESQNSDAIQAAIDQALAVQQAVNPQPVLVPAAPAGQASAASADSSHDSAATETGSVDGISGDGKWDAASQGVLATTAESAARQTQTSSVQPLQIAGAFSTSNGSEVESQETAAQPAVAAVPQFTARQTQTSFVRTAQTAEALPAGSGSDAEMQGAGSQSADVTAFQSIAPEARTGSVQTSETSRMSSFDAASQAAASRPADTTAFQSVTLEAQTGSVQTSEVSRMSSFDAANQAAASQPADVAGIQSAAPEAQASSVQTVQTAAASSISSRSGVERQGTASQPAATTTFQSAARQAQTEVADSLLVAELQAAQATTKAATTEDPGKGPDGSTVPAAASATQKNAAANGTFLLSTLLPQVSGASAYASKTGKSQAAGATFSASSAGVIAAGDTSAPKTGAAKDAGTAPQSVQTGIQPARHTDAGVSQTMAATAGTVQSGTQQSTAFVAHVAAGQTGQEHVSQGSSDATPIRSGAAADLHSDQVNDGVANGTSAINTARVIQSMSESEMRVGMHTSEFGGIAIRTTVSQQQVQAQISVDHGELGNAISAHIPSVQAKLGSDLGLHASIEVNQSGSSLTGGQEQSSQRESRAAVSSNSDADITADPVETFNPAVLTSEADAYRLDIRA
jgi:hypothetical protein